MSEPKLKPRIEIVRPPLFRRPSVPDAFLVMGLFAFWLVCLLIGHRDGGHRRYPGRSFHWCKRCGAEYLVHHWNRRIEPVRGGSDQ